MSRFTGAAAALAVLLATAAAAPAGAQSSKPAAPASRLSPDERDLARLVAETPDDRDLKRVLEQGFAEVEPELYAVFRRDFPEDLDAMEDELIVRLRRGEISEAQIQAFGEEFGESLLDRYERFFMMAPAADLHRTFLGMVAYMRAARRVDPGLCIAIAIDRTDARAPDADKTPELTRLETSMIVAVMETIAAGRRDPTRHQPASDDDLEAMVSGYLRRGGSLEVLRTLAGEEGNPNGYTDEARCNAAIALFEAMTEGGADRTARLVTEEAEEAGTPI
jgi:hypothetical protein